MLPKAAISHSAYGRTRFRVASKRREDAFFAAIAERLRRVDGVGQVEVNAATGSVLVHHRLPLEELARRARQDSLFQVDNEPIERLSDGARRQFGMLNGGISRLTEGRLDLEDLALLLLVIVGLRQLAAGQFAVPAVSAFWYAAGLLTGKEKT
jgi:Heavy metal associated domain 2